MTQDANLQCAAQVMDTFQLVMRTIGPELHKYHDTELSMQQFRAVMIVDRRNGVSLSAVAEDLGTTLSATSKLIDGLVEKKFLTREIDGNDRRRMILDVTAIGKFKLQDMQNKAMSLLAQRLSTLSPSECQMISLAMNILRSSLIVASNTDSSDKKEAGNQDA